VPESGPGRGQRVGIVGEVQIRGVDEAGAETLGRLGQGGLGFGRESQGDRGEEGLGLTGRLDRRGFLEHEVAVRPAHAEGADPGDEGAILVGPGAVAVLDANAQRPERDLGIRLLEVEAGRDLPALDREQRLEQADYARRTLEVADVGLRRADRQRIVIRPRLPKGPAERCGLDRIADRGPGAVQLDVLHVRAPQPGALIRAANHAFLRRATGHGQALARPVVVHGAATDDSVDAVAVRLRHGQRLEGDDAATLSPDIAVGSRIEGEAATVGREAAEPGGAEGDLGVEVEMDPTGERKRRLSLAERLARQVHGYQRGGLGRVDGQAGPGQAERVGDPVGDDAAVQPGHRVATDRIRPASVGQS
jgi:hypothetical protein